MLNQAFVKNNFKEVSGVIIQEMFRKNTDLKLLTPDGRCIGICKNSKYNQLKSKVGECIRVFGQLKHDHNHNNIEVLAFNNEFEGVEVQDEIENLESSSEDVSESCFFDYESIYT